MAIYYYDAHPVQRSKGHSAVAASAYKTGEKIKDERTGIIHDYSKKKDVGHTETISPYRYLESAPWIKDRSTLVNKAEAAERQWNGQSVMNVDLVLPRELTDQQNINLTRDFIRANYTNKGIIVDFAFHNPHASDGGKNPHAHLMLFQRKIVNGEFATTKTTERNWWINRQLVNWRKGFADMQNQHLKNAGHSARVTHEKNDVDQIPTVHMGKHATALEKKGIQTAKGDYNRKVQDTNRVNDYRRALTGSMASKKVSEAIEPKKIDRLTPEPEPQKNNYSAKEKEIIADYVKNFTIPSQQTLHHIRQRVQEMTTKTIDYVKNFSHTAQAQLDKHAPVKGSGNSCSMHYNAGIDNECRRR